MYLSVMSYIFYLRSSKKSDELHQVKIAMLRKQNIIKRFMFGELLEK